MALVTAKIEVPSSAADATEEALLERGVAGWSLLEDAIAGRAWIVGIFADVPEGRRRWLELRPRLPAAPLGKPEWRRLPARQWRHSYRAHFRAWKCGRLHWVPAWQRGKFRLPRGQAVLWLDPGLAFGTGNHETTRLCCERLVAWAEKRSSKGGLRHPRPGRVVDAGCGSGILALSAARLGLRDVVGFDSDPVAVRISRRNAACNGLAGRVFFFESELAAGLAGSPADLVLANIQADVLMRHAPALTGAVASGGTLVMSGILVSERPVVCAAFAALVPDWIRRSRRLGEWCDLVFTRAPAPVKSAVENRRNRK